MRYLIRFISKNAAGGVEHHDRVIDSATVTMGRATDRNLHIRDRRVRLEHAQLERINGDVHIKSSTMTGVVVNGRSQRDAKLAIGDVIEIGSNVIHVIDAPDGVDFALSFELRDDASDEHFATSLADVDRGGISKRRLSWSIAAAVLLLALVIPAISLISPDVASAVRGRVLPDDSFWLAGPLHSGHRTISGECEACHVKPFERVPDAACIECHDVNRHTAGIVHPVLGDMRCASCHREHNTPPELVNRHQNLCADCHTDLPDDVDLEAVDDFLTGHPAFKVSLLLPATGLEDVSGREPDGELLWRIERVSLSEADGAEQSNLKFDHAAHLNPDGILTPDGRRSLDCGECHVPEPGGRGMQSIEMDQHCAGCHALNFEPDDPDRVVPHGDPPAVVQALIEYYSARLLGDDPDAVEQRLRRPGRELTRADRDRAAAEARVRALSVAEDIFERRTCANCHDVQRTDDDEMPWQVLPVRLADSFYPHADFSHAAHETDLTECSGCHAAAESTAASDVLLPGIESCRECHGSSFTRRNSDEQIPSTCIMCHGFHDTDKDMYP